MVDMVAGSARPITSTTITIFGGLLPLILGGGGFQRRAYMLWSFVRGHSFLTIDMKHKAASAEIADWDYLMTISRAILGPAAHA